MNSLDEKKLSEQLDIILKKLEKLDDTYSELANEIKSLKSTWQINKCNDKENEENNSEKNDESDKVRQEATEREKHSEREERREKDDNINIRLNSTKRTKSRRKFKPTSKK